MRIHILTKTIPTLLSIVIFSCSGTPEQSRKPVSQITIENSTAKLIAGQDIVITVDTKLKDGTLDKTKVFIDEQPISTRTELTFKELIKKYNQVGRHTLKVISIKKDGVTGINYKEFTVLSDIIPEQYSYRLVNSFPHNPKYFTEGLEIHDGFLYESTGENGSSGIYKTNLKTGQVRQSLTLDSVYFGEGITIFQNKLYQLTYKHQKGFIYDAETLKLLGTFSYNSNEGWGMTHDNHDLIMSDGTSALTYLDPNTLNAVRKLQVADNEKLIEYLNELEYIDGYIYANVWTTNYILKIDASTGKVLQQIDLSGLLDNYKSEKVDFLNGIAFDHRTGNLYVTGKYWPRIFQIIPVKKG